MAKTEAELEAQAKRKRSAAFGFALVSTLVVGLIALASSIPEKNPVRFGIGGGVPVTHKVDPNNWRTWPIVVPTPTPQVHEVKPPRATLVARPKPKYSLAELKKYRQEWAKESNWYAVIGADKMIAEMEADAKFGK